MGLIMQNKFDELCAVIKKYDRFSVCFSGGVGSTLLLLAAKEALGADNVVALTAQTPFFTGEELHSSDGLARRLGVRLERVDVPLMFETRIVENPPNRCQFCKQLMYKHIEEKAKSMGFLTIGDGRTFCGEESIEFIIAPLCQCKIDRKMAKEILKLQGMGAFIAQERRCIAEFIACGEPITIKKLRWLRAAEHYLTMEGFTQISLCLSEGVIKVSVHELDLLHEMKDDITETLLGMGYKQVLFE